MAKQTMNGTRPVIGAPTGDARIRKLLERLYAVRDENARQIAHAEWTARALDQARTARKQGAIDQMLGQAIASDAARHGDLTARIAAVLANVGPATFTLAAVADLAGCSVTAVRKYVKANGYGWVGGPTSGKWALSGRSSKTGRPAKRGDGVRVLLAQRTATAAILAKYATDEPRPGSLAGRPLGSLVKYGYLKARGDGYVRTAKAYEVTPGAASK